MLQATSYIDPVNTPYARCLGENVYVYREFITVHNFHQFEKVELNKLSRAAKETGKYVLGRQRKSPSNSGVAN